MTFKKTFKQHKETSQQKIFLSQSVDIVEKIFQKILLWIFAHWNVFRKIYKDFKNPLIVRVVV